jgi:hypothetical protein
MWGARLGLEDAWLFLMDFRWEVLKLGGFDSKSGKVDSKPWEVDSKG